MNNPDEETAIAQFGNGDKYFGVATLMCTMPGLPMFGHGQIEGLTEKYGMEYRKAYKDESPDQGLIDRHYREIFPLMKRRYLFAEVEQFYLFDMYRDDGSVNENVFAYTNRFGDEKALVLYNNCYDSTYGSLRVSAGYVQKGDNGDKQMRQASLAEALDIHDDDQRYCLMREQRSGQWIIRRSSELVRQGLRIILNGYQSQVFLEIHEVPENAWGHYRLLHDHLRGAGVPDVAEAIHELVLGPVFAAFQETFGQNLWTRINELFDPSGKDLPELAKEFKACLRAFIHRTQEHAVFKDQYGLAYETFDHILECLVEFNRRLKEMGIAVSENQGKTKPAAAKKTTAADKVPAAKLKPAALGLEQQALAYLLQGMQTPEQRLRIFATVLLSSIAMENEDWRLQKKIPGLGEFQKELPRLITMLEGVRDWKEKEPLAQDLIDALDFMEVQEYLLVNSYDNIQWYNQERFESLCWWAMYWELLHCSRKGTFASHLTKVYERSSRWLAVNAKAEYRMDVLRALLQKPKAGKKA